MIRLLLLTIIVSILVFALNILLIKIFGKKWEDSKFKSILLPIGLVFVVFLYMFPIENFFKTFSTEQELLNYAYYSDYAVDYVIGKESGIFYVTSNDSQTKKEVLRKTEKGWKLGSQRETQVYHFDGYTVRVHKLKKGQDVYVEVTCPISESLNISDSSSSVFQEITISDSGVGKDTRGYISYIPNYDQNYQLYVGQGTVLNLDENGKLILAENVEGIGE